jgi:putative aldouronate transport system permease protein
LWAQRELWLMVLPGLVFYIIFRYGPMAGLKMAFQEYSPFLGDNSPWVGFDQFTRFFKHRDFLRLFRNTLTHGLMSLCINFPANIIFALILNEIRQAKAKKFYQTVSYLPTFFSIVLVCSIFLQVFSVNNGIINKIIAMCGGERINFILKEEWYYFIYVTSGLWAGIGSGAIIYLSALAGVDTQLYEAAELDGCTRLKRIWHITLPSIFPTIVTMFLPYIGRELRIIVSPKENPTTFLSNSHRKDIVLFCIDVVQHRFRRA